MREMQRSLRFGVNYVPSQNWWYSWMDWDASSIREDLEAIASLGMDHIRVHCVWPYFQPNANYVSEAALDRLHELLDIADTCRLDVQVTVLDGWLSGFAFEPAWLLGRNMFTNADVVDAEVKLFESLAERVAHHPRFMGFDLGNELGVMLFKGHDATPNECDAWQERMLSLCEEIAPGKFHINGVDHIHWFSNRGFSRHALATKGSATSLHTWIEFTGARARYGSDGIGSLHLAEYSIELAKAYHRDSNRPVWLQEFGASSQWMPEADIPCFAEQTIRNTATCDNLWGFTWWCSHDLHLKWNDFVPLEYDLGLLDCNNHVKPVGERIAALIREFKMQAPLPLQRTQAVVLRESDFEEADGELCWNFASQYMLMIADGVRPAVVLESRLNDEDYLKARGITELLDFSVALNSSSHRY